MAMTFANPPDVEMRRLIDVHGTARVTRALISALAARRLRSRAAVPDALRTDVGLPPVEREMRRYWELR